MSGVNTVVVDLQTVQRGGNRRTKVMTYLSLDATETEEAATECRTRPAEPGATAAYSLGRPRLTRTCNVFAIYLGYRQTHSTGEGRRRR